MRHHLTTALTFTAMWTTMGVAQAYTTMPGPFLYPEVVTVPNVQLYAQSPPYIHTDLQFSNPAHASSQMPVVSGAVEFLAAFGTPGSIGPVLDGVDGVTETARFVEGDDGEWVRVDIALNLYEPSFIRGASRDAMGRLEFTGGFTVAATAGVWSQGGGLATFSNMKIDHANRQVLFDVQGVANGSTWTLHNLPLWQIGSIAGPTQLPLDQMNGEGDPARLADDMVALGFTELKQQEGLGAIHRYSTGLYQADYRFIGLTLTAEGASFMAQSLRLNQAGISAMNAVGDWGTIESSFVVGLMGNISPVPEPGTWALSVLGMAALIGVARRRQSASH